MDLLIIIVQGLITAFVGYLSFKQKKSLDNFTVQKQFMLELSKPFYQDRILANKEVYSWVSISNERANYFELGIEELEHKGKARLPGFENITFMSVDELFESLVQYPYGQLMKVCTEQSSNLHPDVQLNLEKYLEAYSMFYKDAKLYNNDNSKRISPTTVILMDYSRRKIIFTMQSLYKKIDILNK